MSTFLLWVLLRVKLSLGFISSSCVEWLIVGGILPSLIANIDANDSIAPAAPSKWPVIDFVELIFNLYAWSLKTFSIASTSLLSPSGVDVPWTLI